MKKKSKITLIAVILFSMALIGCNEEKEDLTTGLLEHIVENLSGRTT